MNDTKKLLRFGTDVPQCAKCGNDDRRVRFAASRRGADRLILCANCRAERKRAICSCREHEEPRRLQPTATRSLRAWSASIPVLRMLELDHLAGAANSDRMLSRRARITTHSSRTWPRAAQCCGAAAARSQSIGAAVLQAAFEFGLGAVLGMWAVWDGMHEETARSVFLGVAAGMLIAWALWNLSADEYFENTFGPGYDRAIAAAVPR